MTQRHARWRSKTVLRREERSTKGQAHYPASRLAPQRTDVYLIPRREERARPDADRSGRRRAVPTSASGGDAAMLQSSADTHSATVVPSSKGGRSGLTPGDPGGSGSPSSISPPPRAGADRRGFGAASAHVAGGADDREGYDMDRVASAPTDCRARLTSRGGRSGPGEATVPTPAPIATPAAAAADAAWLSANAAYAEVWRREAKKASGSATRRLTPPRPAAATALRYEPAKRETAEALERRLGGRGDAGRNGKVAVSEE